MKKMAVILATVILVFGFMATGVLSVQTQAQPQMSEEEMQKLGQQMAISQLLFAVKMEKDTTERFIKKLENFQTSDAVLLEKINKNWLPALKEYFKAVACVQSALENFSKRPDLIPKQEIDSALTACYPQSLQADIDRVLEDMDNLGFLGFLKKD